MTAAAWAAQQVAAVRDDPSGRLVLMQRCWPGTTIGEHLKRRGLNTILTGGDPLGCS